MQLAETITFWLAVIAYALSFALFVVSSMFKKPALARHASLAINIAFSLHTIALVLRWLQTGYPPFVAFFESISASAWFGVLGYLILQALKPKFRLAGIGVSASTFLLLGWASTPSYSGDALSASLQSAWLFVHASFATAGVGAFLVAAALSMMWLWRRKRNGDMELPTPASIDEIAFRFISIGFLFYTVMIISGAIWANQAWGRYWGWDPIETWSLITWLIYALYLHLHFTYRKLRGSFTAWYTIVAVLFAAFSLWGVGFIYSTIHTYG